MQKFIDESNLPYKDVIKVINQVSPGIYEPDFVYSSDGTFSQISLKEITNTFKTHYWPVLAS